MPRFFEHARALAAALSQLAEVVVVPDPPQTPLFHTSGAICRCSRSAREVARQRRVRLFHHLEPSVVPGVNKIELNVGESALEISPEEGAELFRILVSA